MDRQLSQYLDRMDYHGDTAPCLASLRALQRRHLERIPYENLDVLHHIPLRFDTESLWEKVVARRRGGVCYELNFLFGDMLRRMGFQVEFLSGMVAGGSAGDFSHALLLVHLPQGDYIADVGFARGFLFPLRLEERGWQSDGRTFYRLRPRGEWYLLERRLPDGTCAEEYRFTRVVRQREDYRPVCDALCASPACVFTYQLVCSLELPGGRLVVRDRAWWQERSWGMKLLRPVGNRAELNRLLRELLGLQEER